MNKDQAKGKWRQMRGMAKRIWGRMTNDDFKKAEGSMDKVYGAVQEKVGDTKKAIGAMLDKVHILAILIVAGFAMGCTATEGMASEKPLPGETAAMQSDRVKTETKEAARAMQEYTYARKAELVAETRKDLAEIGEELDRLSARVDRSKGEAKADAKVRLDAVRENWAQAKKRLDSTEAATESAWNDAVRGLVSSRDALTDSFDKTCQWLSDKIEP